jgi:signal recognition particle receptor subunit beta
MAYADSELTEDAPGTRLAIKFLIAGGLGAGKTTLVRAVSEIGSVHTEEPMSTQGTNPYLLGGLEQKTATTVALDFGRITINDEIVVHLFGTPGQKRFWFMRDELAYGAVGAVVLVDIRRLADCFHAVDYLELRQIPFVVAINCFDGAPRFDAEAVRVALDLEPEVPIIYCDARDWPSCRDVLVVLVDHVRQALEAVEA